jgi:diguanylate cyclase (GGDEF)-like protein
LTRDTLRAMRLRRRDSSDFDAAEAARVAMYDDVTGLAGRFLFFDRLGLALARTERRNSSAAVLLLDLDGFPRVAERAGRATAEEALREVADRLMTVIRPGDSAARVGDGQFAVLCEEIDGEPDAISIAERLAAALAFPFELAEAQVHLSASVGIAMAGGRHADPDAVIRGAGAAMRSAREHGGARFEVFHPPSGSS